MEGLVIVGLILLGAVLVIMEFLVFPGVNVVGILGFGCMIAGIYCGYAFYGTAAGHAILLTATLLGFGVTWYALRSKTWKRFSLHTQLDSTVEGVDASVRVGDTGVTLSRLAPMGNVQVGEVVAEAESQSGYIDARQPVEVVKVFKNKIVVKLKTV